MHHMTMARTAPEVDHGIQETDMRELEDKAMLVMKE